MGCERLDRLCRCFEPCFSVLDSYTPSARYDTRQSGTRLKESPRLGKKKGIDSAFSEKWKLASGVGGERAPRPASLGGLARFRFLGNYTAITPKRSRDFEAP